MRPNFCLKLLRLFLGFSLLIKFKISKILSFKLFEARELLKMKAKNNVLIKGSVFSKNKNNLSKLHPVIPVKDITINVINQPPIYNLNLLSFASPSATLLERLITQPINWTGCGMFLGSPIKRSKRTANKTTLMMFLV